MDNFYKQLMSLAIIGAAIGFAKELRDGKINKKDGAKACGRVLLSAGLAVSAAAAQLYFTGASFVAIAGLAAALVVLGDITLGKIMDKGIDKLFSKKDDNGA